METLYHFRFKESLRIFFLYTLLHLPTSTGRSGSIENNSDIKSFKLMLKICSEKEVYTKIYLFLTFMFNGNRYL